MENSPNQDELSLIRQKIDTLDTQIMTLLANRQSQMAAIVAYKKTRNMPLYQPDREQEILKVKTELAKTLGLDPALIETIFLAIFENSRKIQKES